MLQQNLPLCATIKVLRDIISDLFIVHVGAIDVPLSKINNEVDEDIVKLAETIKANIGNIAT